MGRIVLERLSIIINITSTTTKTTGKKISIITTKTKTTEKTYIH